MGSWIWCICIGSVGMFFVVLNYIALIRSKCRRKRKTQKNDTQNAKNFKKIGE